MTASQTPHTDAVKARKAAAPETANAAQRITIEIVHAASLVVAQAADQGIAVKDLRNGHLMAAQNVMANACMSAVAGNRAMAAHILTSIAQAALEQINNDKTLGTPVTVIEPGEPR
jgi:hypothetical protein